VSRLADILDSKRREVEALRRRPRRRVDREPTDVVGALRRGPGQRLRLIAEIKLRSPSAGPLSRALAPSERALVYAGAGATMISVLCDGPYFDGSWEHLTQVRASLDGCLDVHGRAVPILAKEFVIDERQVAEARDRGADAVLLIVRTLDVTGLGTLVRAARAERVEPVVEVMTESELEMALGAGAGIVAVNARDLDTLEMDPARAARVLARIPPDRVAVHFSGVREPADVARIAAGRAEAALLGEALMRDDDPGPRLRSLVAASGS
jgi:indole-3-glycerol phosphate synthase